MAGSEMAMKDALSRRKNKVDETNKRLDLAPEVNDAPNPKLSIQIGVQGAEAKLNPMERGDAADEDELPEQMGEGEAHIQNLMGKNSNPQDMERIKREPKGLFEKGMKALLEKRK